MTSTVALLSQYKLFVHLGHIIITIAYISQVQNFGKLLGCYTVMLFCNIPPLLLNL